MQHEIFKSRMHVPASDVFAWHARPGAFERLTPPWRATELESQGAVEDGERTVFQVSVGPFRVNWVAEHRDVRPGAEFTDVQVRGPLRAWSHVHRFYDDGAEGDGSYLEDRIDYALPLDGVGKTLAGGFLRRELQRTFAYRHRVTRDDTAAIRRYDDGRKLRIAVSGASGVVGSALVPFLRAAGHQVFRIVRHEPENPAEEIHWDQTLQTLEKPKLEGLDAVIHLAGEDVLTPRWSDQKKMEIYASRVRSTELFARTLARLSDPPSVFLTASGIAYYGNRGNEVLTEASAPGEKGFLTALCQDWEAAAADAAAAGIRTAQLRMGLVLSPRGNPFGRLLPAFRLGLGGPFGEPGQYLSWIALDDLLHALYHLLRTDGLEGAFNLTAPEPVTVERFAGTLGRVLHRPSFLRVPPSVFRLYYGEVADETVLLSTRAIPERLRASGYQFLYPDLEDALRHVLGRSGRLDHAAAASPTKAPAVEHP